MAPNNKQPQYRPHSRQSTLSDQSERTTIIQSQPHPSQSQSQSQPQSSRAAFQVRPQIPQQGWMQNQQMQSQASQPYLKQTQISQIPQQSQAWGSYNYSTTPHYEFQKSFNSQANFPLSQARRVASGNDFNQHLARENGMYHGVDFDSLSQADSANGDRKKSGSIALTNDNELRRLFQDNANRDLAEIAQQVTKDEKGPKAEKSKQIFGMLWLAKNVRVSSRNVPRARVYAAYAGTCGNERVPPLNPASFGKLVRIVFPGLQTRRLGVRGESKYHYCDLSLVDANGQDISDTPIRDMPEVENATQQIKAGSVDKILAIEPAPEASANAQTPPPPSAKTDASSTVMSNGCAYLQNPFTSAPHLAPSLIYRPLQFTVTEPPQPGRVVFDLPDISPYLPPGTDTDAVNSLTSVYRSHCILAIDNFRFCMTDKFSDTYKSLTGLLTVPGQKLLAHPAIAPWLTKCDLLKYQKMIPILDMILLTKVPDRAMRHMEYIGHNLCGLVGQFFSSQPMHVINAMLKPATLFSSLIDRFLRVSRAGTDVASLLENSDVRKRLWDDWIAHANPLQVVQNSCGIDGEIHNDLLQVLTFEARFLISPPEPSLFENLGVFAGTKEKKSSFMLSELEDFPDSTCLERLTRFVTALPLRFPQVPTRLYLMLLETTTGTISRNLTLGGASSLTDWWKIQLFINEMTWWLAERGGLNACEGDWLINGRKSSTSRKRRANDSELDTSASLPRFSLNETHTDLHSDDEDGPSRKRQRTAGANDSMMSLPTQTPASKAHLNVLGLKTIDRRSPYKFDAIPIPLPGEHDDSGIGMPDEFVFVSPSKYKDLLGSEDGNVGAGMLR